MFRFLYLSLYMLSPLVAEPLDLALPTENQHLFTGKLNQFYMYVDRTFEGETTKPYDGGAFGYTRSPIRVNGDVVMTRFHEGIDIAPVKRDKAGNPLDLIMSISKGVVVHVADVPGRSNYGKYVVVEHQWEAANVYSLYAHLAEITVKMGDPVATGSVLGRMGYTGAGINRTRAHVHLEVAFKMSDYYESWHKKYFGSANYHGNYNGMNLAGVDVTSLFLEHKKNPQLQFSEFILSQEVQFKVIIPAHPTPPNFLERHPWMKRGDVAGAISWEIGFSATGHAISFTPSIHPVSAPTLSHIRPSKIPQRWLTRGLITGDGKQAALSNGGKQMLALLLNDTP